VNPTCADLDKLPTFQFKLGGRTIPFYPKDYAKKVSETFHRACGGGGCAVVLLAVFAS
jgi:hypothetical protein